MQDQDCRDLAFLYLFPWTPGPVYWPYQELEPANPISTRPFRDLPKMVLHHPFSFVRPFPGVCAD
jgi:hypothetical protein